MPREESWARFRQDWRQPWQVPEEAPRVRSLKQIHEEALSAARSLGLNRKEEWRAWCKSGARAANMPTRPDRNYKRRMAHLSLFVAATLRHLICTLQSGPAREPRQVAVQIRLRDRPVGGRQ